MEYIIITIVIIYDERGGHKRRRRRRRRFSIYTYIHVLLRMRIINIYI